MLEVYIHHCFVYITLPYAFLVLLCTHLFVCAVIFKSLLLSLQHFKIHDTKCLNCSFKAVPVQKVPIPVLRKEEAPPARGISMFCMIKSTYATLHIHYHASLCLSTVVLLLKILFGESYY